MRGRVETAEAAGSRWSSVRRAWPRPRRVRRRLRHGRWRGTETGGHRRPVLPAVQLLEGGARGSIRREQCHA